MYFSFVIIWKNWPLFPPIHQFYLVLFKRWKASTLSIQFCPKSASFCPQTVIAFCCRSSALVSDTTDARNALWHLSLVENEYCDLKALICTSLFFSSARHNSRRAETGVRCEDKRGELWKDESGLSWMWWRCLKLGFVTLHWSVESVYGTYRDSSQACGNKLTGDCVSPFLLQFSLDNPCTE